MQFNTLNRKVKIAIVVSIAILGIIAFRIYLNMAANQERAQRVFQGTQVSVDTEKVERKSILPTLVFSANLDPVWSADISPKVDSRLDKLYVDEGDVVKEGQVLAQMDILELSAQIYQLEGVLYEALAESNDAAVEYERNKKLYAQDAISKQALDNSKYRMEMMRGRYTAAQGGLNALNERRDAATIRAPRDGVITRRHVHAGYYVKSGSPIVSIADTRTLLAKADISEGQITSVIMGAEAEIAVSAYQDKMFSGNVSRISPLADLPARTFKTEISVPNSTNELRAGMFATVHIKGKVRDNVIVIPQTAIVMREDQKTVYIVNSENVVQQVLLVTGAIENDMVEIISGLSEGDTIVTSGQNKLRQGVKISEPVKGEAGKN